MLEANHDEVLLHSSNYPYLLAPDCIKSWALIKSAAARFAVELMHPRLAGIVLAHLSNECNSGDLALKVVGGALKEAGWSGYLDVAEQNHPTTLLDIEDLRYREGPAQLSLI